MLTCAAICRGSGMCCRRGCFYLVLLFGSGQLHIRSHLCKQYGVAEQVEDLANLDQWHLVLYHHVQQHAWGRLHSTSSQFESAPLWWRTAWGGR